MPYIIVDKSIREAVSSSELDPVLTDPNLLVIKVKSLDSYEFRVFAVYPTGEIAEDGSSIVSEKWFPGTSFTQAQIDAEVTRQANQLAKIQAAVSTVVAGVNGKLVTGLTTTDVRNLLAILMAEKDWISSTGRVQIPTDYKLI